ncbi:MAG: hypothetical protein B7Z80_10520 [Rhodospirillales bacterium 20-64-7]|nr:MAG: hypothetical protein B7Z80_10520 [Rhodospirillales bacterium 20-64-7]HQT77075.1 hypothetical protein [Rhodopila sp.]
MASFEDILGGNLAAAAAFGVVALVLPKVAPNLPLPVRSALTGGVNLFLEAEGEAEGGIIDRLAETVLQNVLQNLSAPAPEDERHRAARAAVEDFAHAARRRARRYARNERDRSARYSRHMAALRHKLKRAQAHPGSAHAAVLSDMVAALDQRPFKPDQESSHGTA